MKIIDGGEFTGERAMFASKGVRFNDALFFDGESPLKESSNIELYGCTFGWKYPLWYCDDVYVKDSLLEKTARSGIWYTHNIEITDSVINAPKTFRRSCGIKLKNVQMPNAEESMWNCSDISLENVSVKGDYFCFGSSNITVNDFEIDGNYVFDGGKNIEINRARLISKDALWNCENVTVRDSLIVGEYLGWNSKNITLINCTIESNQGMCYMQNLVLKGCKLRNTDLCFEYCTVDADVDSHIDSIKNPISGRIKANSIGEIILDPDCVDVTKTEITMISESPSAGKRTEKANV